MLTKRKIWSSAALIATTMSAVVGCSAGDDTRVPAATGTPAATDTAQPAAGEDFPGGSFEDALEHVFAGEGGEGGLGFSALENQGGRWSFTVPALSGEQLTKALSGNSLRQEAHYAMHLEPSGQYRGWALSWEKAPMAQCPSDEGPNHSIDDGQCWVASEGEIKGTWSVKDDTLCLSPAPEQVSGAHDCVRAALVLNDVVLFGPDGKMIGKGNNLLKGENAARERKES